MACSHDTQRGRKERGGTVTQLRKPQTRKHPQNGCDQDGDNALLIPRHLFLSRDRAQFPCNHHRAPAAIEYRRCRDPANSPDRSRTQSIGRQIR